MDPIVMIAIGVLILFIVLKMFFGIAKMLFRVVILVVVAVLVWRVLSGQL